MLTVLHENALLVLIGFPVLMIGMQVLLFMFPGEAGKPAQDRG